MKGILKSIELRECESKDKKKFKVVEYKVDVRINDKGEIKTLRGSMSEDYARKYFAFCGVKTKEVIGKEVDVVKAKREYESNGEKRTIEFCKFLNLIDDNGEVIIMRKNSSQDLDF